MDDQSATLHPPVNKGREAMGYLTYIIDHYNVLPDINLFLHPHRDGWPVAWHNDANGYDNAESARNLKLDYVRTHGYANMRCIAIPGCPDEVQILRDDPERTHERAYKQAYKFMFQVSDDSVPQVVGTPCCSQFAVSKARILMRPLSDYQRYRQWLIDTELTSDVSGRVLEYMWHIIFGKNAVWCPNLHECWCEQFGRCEGRR